jgi:uncharacterized glyoxalase superfamily protein PhnB
MAKTHGKPPHMPTLSPYLVVKDADTSLAFYEKAFGFTKREAVPGPNGKTMHAEMTWNDAVIMFGSEGEYPNMPPMYAPATIGKSSPVGLYLYCDDVDATYQRAVAAGCKSLREPWDAFWGDRMCNVIDPDGHSWTFASWLGQEQKAGSCEAA